MTNYREQIAQASRAVAITSSTSYAWFGRRSPPLPRPVRSALTADAARAYLVGLLERELYRSFYTQGIPVPRTPGGETGWARPDRSFVAALSEANTGAGAWEPGWRLAAVEHQSALVTRNGVSVRVQASDCRPVPSGSAAVGAVSLRRPKELRAVSPGFYTAVGDRGFLADPEDTEVRVYFNVTPEGALPLVGACTRQLNEEGVAFSLKVVDHRSGFLRCDPAVLYLDGRDFEEVRESIGAIASVCEQHLRPEAPAFAKPLIPGVALGEHRPRLGTSFGFSRCRLVAEGIVTARDSGAGTHSDPVDAVACRFAEQGLNIEYPYLAPGSADRYEW